VNDDKLKKGELLRPCIESSFEYLLI